MSAISHATMIAKEFHRHYERLAPRFEYATKTESAVPWEEVSQKNRDLMVATVETLLDQGVIAYTMPTPADFCGTCRNARRIPHPNAGWVKPGVRKRTSMPCPDCAEGSHPDE